MATDNNTTQKPSEAPQNQPTVVKPDVPEPAGPIGTKPSNYTTHAENPSKWNIRTTDAESLPKSTIRMTEGLDASGKAKET
jgi:hypothetical protein